MKVIIKKGNFDRALRQFKRKITEEGLLQEVREREYYEKPSDGRRGKLKAAKNRERKRDGVVITRKY
tara:strand:+ start:851 stop:1051 length:201 start_codon:yes stop_codon:yes gene_type:complete